MKKEKGKNIVTRNDPWRHYGRQEDTIQTDKNIAKRLACVQPPLPSIFLRGGVALHRLQKDPITLRLAILVEVEETQNAHNQAPSYRPM